ncbi:Fic/DOC family N-terminal domain-containing protein [Acetobacter cerevisiae]|uniref:Fic/DOC family N-terminal domain-containing protein n=1 Tax=Acetobacter cerevisiae TaxID=178900 RepID=UPI001E442C73|nr:Fic/DOC family N-terminal domain-containing protein [Acetobacter cerevisiae]
MNRQDLTGGIRECLTRLPSPYENHYGVVPPPPPESGVYLDDITALHSQAMAALGEIAEWARTSTDPYLISRTLRSKEAVSSSAMEGTHSTLDELLIYARWENPTSFMKILLTIFHKKIVRATKTSTETEKS